jgi:hypothetical protein
MPKKLRPLGDNWSLKLRTLKVKMLLIVCMSNCLPQENNKIIIKIACGLLAFYEWLMADGKIYKYMSCAFKHM